MSQAPATTRSIEGAPGAGRSLWADARRRLLRDRAAVLCFGVIVVYAATAIAAGILFSDWASRYDYDNLNRPPSAESWKFWLGTDDFGRSVLIKTMLGVKVSMTVGVAAMVIAIPLGILLGAAAGYYGGFLDDLIVWLFTTLASVPGLIRVIAVKFAFQDVVFFQGTWAELDMGGLPGVIVALSITGWIGTCRIVRAETMKIRELDYVLAARAAGRSGFAILLRHVVPNVVHIGIINFSLGFVGCVAAEVALSYLGLGVPGLPSWGNMIDAARDDLIVGRWWQITSAGVAMFVLVLAMNIFGDRLRDALDPRLRHVNV